MNRRDLAYMAIAALGLWLIASGARAQPAPRPVALVEGDTIRLADLFEGAGERGGSALGAAPGPGRRIVVEAAQLAAIARLYGLAWRPMTGQERSVVERPGRPLSRDDVLDPLRAELIPLGLDGESEIEIPGFSPPLVPLAALAQVVIETPHFDAQTRRFSATLAVLADGMPGQRIRLAGRAVATVPVVVATRRLAVGDVVQPTDARVTRLRAERVRPGAAERLDQIIGRQLRRPIATELPFHTADLSAPHLVQRNGAVTMVLEAPGLALSAQGRALEAAPRGAVVPVMNLASRSVVEAEVIGPGRVRVAMGAVPVALR
jgi:flagellar basal body P-ring formation protein FlgA